LSIDLRWGDNVDRLGGYAAELVSLAPEVIITNGTAAIRSLQRATQTIPIVFAGGGDPQVANLVRNVARPEGNITGFSSAGPSIAGKQFQLLKEAAPRITKVGAIFTTDLVSQISLSYFASIEAAASASGVQPVQMRVHNPVDVVDAIDAFAAEPHGGLVVLPPPPINAIRTTILQLTTKHRLPTIYPSLTDAAAGGLLAYAADRVDQYRRAASYVDRLLRGVKVSELPVQFPTKFQLAVNLKTAKALALTAPRTLLALADKVID
jgi:putative tryptophan/tyrosine transport system substrate-binding protein